MKKLDIHVHCNINDPETVAGLMRTGEELETMIALSGGERGEKDFAPNERVMEIAREYSGLVVPLALIPLRDQSVDPAQVYALAEQGFRGLKLIYPYHAYDHDFYIPLYEAAEKCALPIIFHTGLYRPCNKDKRFRRPILTNMEPVRLDRIARSFQDLKIIMAHMGTSIWRIQAAQMMRLHANVYADLAGCGSWMAMSAEELVELLRAPLFLHRADYHCFNKLVLGSDAYTETPLIMKEAQFWYSMHLQKIGIPEDIQNNIMGKTAASWFGVSLES